MFNPFKKNPIKPFKGSSGDSYNITIHPFVKEELQGDVPTTLTEFMKVDGRQLKKDVPNFEDYQLREMLKLGFVPQPVNVSGMLDSDDPLSTQNVEFVNESVDYIDTQNNKDSQQE